MSEFVPVMSAIAREAGELLMQHFSRHVKIEYKGDVDLVTAADRASEALIMDRIQARFPRHDLLGEEGARRLTAPPTSRTDSRCSASPWVLNTRAR